MTEVGKFLRQYRLKHQWTLTDMAGVLGVDTAWLSGLGNGRRAVPDDFIDMMTKHFRLSQIELRELTDAVAIDQKK